MDAAGKISALALIAAILCVLIRDHQKHVSLLLSLAACVSMIVLCTSFLEPILEVLNKLIVLSGIVDDIVSPMLKVAGIGLLTQISAGICIDAGENALGKTVELVGNILALYASLPLLIAALELVEKMAGGAG